MKKLLHLLLLTTGILLLGGCASVTDNIVINSDGEVLRHIEIVVDENENTIGAALAYDEIYKQGEAQGFEVSYKEKDNGQKVYHLQKTLDKVDPNNISISYHQELFDEDSQNMVKPEVLTITKNENLFKTEYLADSNFKVTALESLEEVDYTLKVHLPVEAKGETNASEKDGNTLVWKANKEHTVNAKFNVTSWDFLTIAWVVGGSMILICSLALFILRKKENKEDSLIDRRIPKPKNYHRNR